MKEKPSPVLIQEGKYGVWINNKRDVAEIWEKLANQSDR